MKFYAPISFSHRADEFWRIYHASSSAVEQRRAQFFALLAEGRSESEVLAITRYSARSARTIVGRYHALGLEGLKDGRAHNQGAPRVLSVDEQQCLAAQLQADFEQGIVWDGAKVVQWVREHCGKDVYVSRAYEFMRAAGFSPRQLRPQHVGADPVAQEAFRSKS